MTLDLPNRVLLTVAAIALTLALLDARPTPATHEHLSLNPLVLAETGRVHVRDEGFQVRAVRPSAATPTELAGLEEVDASWLVVAPGEARGAADPRWVEAMIKAWRQPVRSSAYAFPIGSIEDLETLGFDRPDTVLLNIERARDDEIISVEIGKETRGGRYLREEGLGAVYVVRVPGIEFLSADASLWRDRSAGTAEARAVRSFGLRGRFGQYEFARDGEAWAMERGEVALSQRAIEELLGDLAVLHTWGADNDGGEDWPAEVPYTVAAWLVRDDGTRVDYEIVGANIEGGPRYRSQETVPRELPDAVLAALDRDPAAMDRELWSPAPGPLTYRLSRGDQVAELVRGADGSWRFAGELEVGAGTVADALAMLERLRPDVLLPSPPTLGPTPLRVQRVGDGTSEELWIAVTPDEGDAYHAAAAGDLGFSLRVHDVRKLLRLVPGPPPPEPPPGP